jgi:hypothetical protein
MRQQQRVLKLKKKIINKTTSEIRNIFLEKLSINDLEALVRFFNKIREELKEENNDKFLLPRKKEHFLEILNDSNSIICGVKDLNNNIIAIASYQDLNTIDKLNTRYPKNELNKVELSYGIFSSVCCSKSYRGFSLLKHMDEYIKSQRNLKYSLATAKEENTPSLKAFDKIGFKIHKKIISPIDNAKICLLIREN